MRTEIPYNYNMPVEPDMFFGRQGDIEALVRNLIATPGDSFAVIGGRRMGKTSLIEALLRALHTLAEQPTTSVLPVPISLDFTGEGIESVASLLRTIGKQAQIELAGWPVLQQGEAVTIADDQPPAPVFGRALDAWAKAVMAHRRYRLRLILLLDECEQIIEQPWATELCEALRYLLVGPATRSLIKVVMAGSHRFFTQVRQRGSPLRNVLTYHTLQVLDAQATRDLIVKPTGNALPSKVVQAVETQSGGHPFLTQYIMHHLWERGLECATSDSVQKIAEGFPHERSDFQDWTVGLGETAVKAYEMLTQANEPLAESTMRGALKPTRPDLVQALDALCYHGLVMREEKQGRYQVAGAMFRDWFVRNVALSSTVAPRTQPDAVSVHSQPSPVPQRESDFRYDVFVSYSHKDIVWVRDTLLPRLEQEGLRVCVDYRDFEIGVPSLVNMERAVDHSRHTLLVLTPAWVESEWTEFESLLAGTADPAGRRQKLIPLMIEPCKPPPRIAMLTCADFAEPSDYTEQFNRLLRQLATTSKKAIVPKQQVIPEAITFPVAYSSVLHDVPTPEEQFVGRELLINELLASEKATRMVAILGIPGIGKSALMKQIINHLDRDRVFWYEFQPGLLSLEDVLVKLARFLDSRSGHMGNLAGAIRAPTFTEQDRIDLIIRALNADHYFLFFDSVHHVEDQSALSSFFSLLKERLSQSRVFVASRSRPEFLSQADEAKHLAKSVSLDGLTTSEVVEFFAKRDITFALEMAEALDVHFGGLPIALDFVAVLLAKGVTAKELSELIGEAEERAIDYLFDEVCKRLGPAERTLLTTASLFIFPFSEDQLLGVHQAIFTQEHSADLFTKLRHQVTTKCTRSSGRWRSSTLTISIITGFELQIM